MEERAQFIPNKQVTPFGRRAASEFAYCYVLWVSIDVAAELFQESALVSFRQEQDAAYKDSNGKCHHQSLRHSCPYGISPRNQ